MKRRRFLQIVGAVGATGVLGDATWRRDVAPPVEWRGAALGAESKIQLYAPEPGRAARLIAASLAEIERLERIFSLHRPDSELARLNRDGRLPAPSHDLVELLAQSRRLGDRSGGAFDVTVEPLWQLYAAHFGRHPQDEAGPDERAVAAARSRVDYRSIEIEPGLVALARGGAAVTLNGIAQGWITDRVADLLRDSGVDDVMVATGEIRARGAPPGQAAWNVAVRDSRRPERIGRMLPLTDRALAVSGGYGSTFDRAGRFHHLFDPATGAPAHHYAGVAVMAPRATLADALSTALSILPPAPAAVLARSFPGVTATFDFADGRSETIGL